MLGISANNYRVISPSQNKFIEKVFKDCSKNVYRSEVRDADWGLYAAQTCMAKDLITATPEEADLIKEKMEFIQNIINQNMKMDEDIFILDEDQKRQLIHAQADAKAKVLPARAALITDTLKATSGAMDSASNLAVNSTKAIANAKLSKTPTLSLVA